MNIHYHADDGCFRLFAGYSSIFEISNSFGLGLSIELPSDWHEEQLCTLMINLGWPLIFIKFPWFKRYEDHFQCSGPRLGFQFFEDLLWFYHGNSTGRPRDKSYTALYMPWSWNYGHYEHEVQNKYGDWVPFVDSLDERKGQEADGRVEETHPYTYILKNGEVQERQATIFIERRTWFRKFWLPHQMSGTCIAVSFDDEVGERSGSWKGGTTGCGYDLLPDETSLECLRRMEANRKF